MVAPLENKIDKKFLDTPYLKKLDKMDFEVKIRDNKKEARGGNVDGDIEVDRGRIRNSDSQDNRPTLVRQRGFQRRRGRPRRTLGVDRG